VIVSIKQAHAYVREMVVAANLPGLKEDGLERWSYNWEPYFGASVYLYVNFDYETMSNKDIKRLNKDLMPGTMRALPRVEVSWCSCTHSVSSAVAATDLMSRVAHLAALVQSVLDRYDTIYMGA